MRRQTGVLNFRPVQPKTDDFSHDLGQLVKTPRYGSDEAGTAAGRQTYPGTTREVMKPILEDTGLVSGQDFFLAFSPEREDPAHGQREFCFGAP
jgi:hypothetical protein